jgi:hypothetical protein
MGVTDFENRNQPAVRLETTKAKVRKDNTSGYLGVSLDKIACKWAAYIRRSGKRYYLGHFTTPEAASAAYQEADARLGTASSNRRSVLLGNARQLYLEHGLSALTTDALNETGVTEGKLRRVGLSHADLLAELGLAEDYKRWREETFIYAGKKKPRWTWKRAIEVAGHLVDQENDLPTVQWCRLNGHSQLVNTVHRLGRNWEDLRAEIGLPNTVMRNGRPRYFDSRIGIRWRSRPEACLSNFLYARGVEHKRGERYPQDYTEKTGRAYGRYDLHFIAQSGDQIDVEIWGDIPDAYSHGRYGDTRAKKEVYQGHRPNFLGLQYLDCLSEVRLTKLLAPFIGTIEPFRFVKPQDRLLESAHWSEADELLEECRKLAAQMPDGVFPNEQWLRKRGKFADRPGEALNTLSRYVQTQLKGTRNVRTLLGQSEASTTKWTQESVIEAWKNFEAKHSLTPAQCKGAHRSSATSREIAAEGARIYEAARRLGVVDQFRGGQIDRKRKWTAERVERDWAVFCAEIGLAPTGCMSKSQRARLPRSVTDRATRLYQVAKRLGLLDKIRGVP